MLGTTPTTLEITPTTFTTLGGLLSAYELSGEAYPVLLRKAVELGDRLLFNFNTTLGIPLQTINLATREGANPVWMGNRCLHP